MKVKNLMFLSCSMLFFCYNLAYFLYDFFHQDNTAISCTAFNKMTHNDISLNSKNTVSMRKGIGAWDIIGTVHQGGNNFIVNRQIHFEYVRLNSTFILNNVNTEYLSDDDSKFSSINLYLPPFFNQPKGKLTLEIAHDHFKNTIMYYGGVPVFYCIKK